MSVSSGSRNFHELTKFNPVGGAEQDALDWWERPSDSLSSCKSCSYMDMISYFRTIVRGIQSF